MNSTAPETGVYRWIIVLCSFLTLFVSNGMTLGGITVFDLELLASLSEISGAEVQLDQLKVRDGLMFLTAGILGIAAGWMADRIGVKPLIIAGLVLLALCNLAYSQVQALTSIYVIHLGLGLVLVLCGLMINVYLISRWFTKGRGLAIGLVLAGTSLGNAFFPQLNTWLMTEMGLSWREVFQWLALVPVALLPVAIFVLKSAPDDSAEGKSGGPGDARSAAAELPGYSLGEALRSRNFWIICTLAFCTFYSILGMMTVTFVFLREAEYPAQLAATGVSILFLGGLVGKIIAGFLAETLGRKQVLLVSLGLMFIGSIALLLAVVQGGELYIWIGLIGFGFGWGGIYTLIQMLSADLFGLKALGKILGGVNVVDTLGGAMGPVITSSLYVSTKSFELPFMVITALLLVAILAAAMLRMSDAAYLQAEPQTA
ncbi:MAG: MFS transporter [Gammaproteobacteria bacterium]|nr:MFS transporter [Gammaproteobacteria bacterium]